MVGRVVYRYHRVYAIFVGAEIGEFEGVDVHVCVVLEEGEGLAGCY